MSLDRLSLRGLRAWGRHGVLAHEREEGQTFVVDAVLRLDTRSAAAEDDLARSVDYGALAGRLVAVIEGKPVRLIETLAGLLADECLLEPGVKEAEVTVHKPEAPVPFPVDDIAVTILRSRR